MISLPYDFDTASVWRKIVRGVLLGVATLLLLIAATLATGKLTAAAQLALVTAIVGLIVWRVRNFPMGAIGTITATEVMVHPATAYGLPLRVPTGRFPIGDFQSVRLEQRLASSGTAGLRQVGRVYLVGRGNTPEIQVVTALNDDAPAAARELAALFHLEVVETVPAGVTRLAGRV